MSALCYVCNKKVYVELIGYGWLEYLVLGGSSENDTKDIGEGRNQGFCDTVAWTAVIQGVKAVGDGHKHFQMWVTSFMDNPFGPILSKS